MLVVRCKSCGKELSSDNGKSQCCGCPNMTSIVGDRITAVDLSQVVIVKMRVDEKSNQTSLSNSDIEWQEHMMLYILCHHHTSIQNILNILSMNPNHLIRIGVNENTKQRELLIYFLGSCNGCFYSSSSFYCCGIS